MNRTIAQAGATLLSVGALVLIVGSIVVCIGAVGTPNSAPGAVLVAAIIGLIGGTLVAAVCFGPLAAIYDMRASLAELVEISRRTAAKETMPTTNAP